MYTFSIINKASVQVWSWSRPLSFI